jgi:diphthine synthase
MGDLLFVGMGLYDERDLSLRALDELKSVGTIFAEQYTSKLSDGSMARLERLLGKRIIELTREQLEGESVVLEALGHQRKVALLVAGEPFAATTHMSLRLTVERDGHSWRVLHNASIVTAAASVVGLSQYKFGRIVTLPHPDMAGFHPSSPYEALVANQRADFHTLMLMDIDAVINRYLTANVALRRLGAMEDEIKEGVARPDDLFCVVARVGSPETAAWVGTRKELENMDFGPPLHSIIVPAPHLHFLEKEALDRWRAKKV